MIKDRIISNFKDSLSRQNSCIALLRRLNSRKANPLWFEDWSLWDDILSSRCSRFSARLDLEFSAAIGRPRVLVLRLLLVEAVAGLSAELKFSFSFLLLWQGCCRLPREHLERWGRCSANSLPCWSLVWLLLEHLGWVLDVAPLLLLPVTSFAKIKVTYWKVFDVLVYIRLKIYCKLKMAAFCLQRVKKSNIHFRILCVVDILTQEHDYMNEEY